MKKIFLIITLSFLLPSAYLYADAKKGEELYKKKGCNACHHPTKDQLSQGLGPSYVMVAAAYKKGPGKTGLMKFLMGESQPRVAPEKFSLMKPQLAITKKLKDSERSDLADFILAH